MFPVPDRSPLATPTAGRPPGRESGTSLVSPRKGRDSGRDSGIFLINFTGMVSRIVRHRHNTRYIDSTGPV